MSLTIKNIDMLKNHKKINYLDKCFTINFSKNQIYKFTIPSDINFHENFQKHEIFKIL